MTISRNEKLANDIKDFLEEFDIAYGTRIYFDGKAYHFDSMGVTVIHGLLPTEFFEYGNNETVSMSFEGRLNHILNYGTDRKIEQKFNDIFKSHNCYYELGYAWSLSVYYDEEV